MSIHRTADCRTRSDVHGPEARRPRSALAPSSTVKTQCVLALVMLVFACGAMASERHKHQRGTGSSTDCTVVTPPKPKHHHVRHGSQDPPPPTTDCGGGSTTGGGATDPGSNSSNAGGSGNTPGGDGGNGGAGGNGGNGGSGGNGADGGDGGNGAPPDGSWIDPLLGGNLPPGGDSSEPPPGGYNDPPSSRLSSNSVPEPGTLPLICATLLGLVFVRRAWRASNR